MKLSATLPFLLLILVILGCDLRSGIAIEEMEKFNGTPTPTASPTPVEAPIDPAEIVQIDTATEGTRINADGSGKKSTVTCT